MSSFRGPAGLEAASPCTEHNSCSGPDTLGLSFPNENLGPTSPRAKRTRQQTRGLQPPALPGATQPVCPRARSLAVGQLPDGGAKAGRSPCSSSERAEPGPLKTQRRRERTGFPPPRPHSALLPKRRGRASPSSLEGEDKETSEPPPAPTGWEEAAGRSGAPHSLRPPRLRGAQRGPVPAGGSGRTRCALALEAA